MWPAAAKILIFFHNIQVEDHIYTLIYNLLRQSLIFNGIDCTLLFAHQSNNMTFHIVDQQSGYSTFVYICFVRNQS